MKVDESRRKQSWNSSTRSMQGYMEEVVKITSPSKKKKRNQLCEENTKNDLGLKRVELSPFQRVCSILSGPSFHSQVLKSMIFEEEVCKAQVALFFCRQIEQYFIWNILHCVWNSEPVVVQHHVTQVCNAECFKENKRQFFGCKMRKGL